MKKYCKWKDEEIKKLFSHIENNAKNGLTLTVGFKSFAEKSGRKPNSVRNYYYAELENLLKNANDANRLEINLDLHQKNNPTFFTEKEAETTFNSINNLVSKGYSVRKACLTLAKCDIGQMVRLQNKFRTMIKAKQDKKIIPNNIISMPQKTMCLTDNEINSLFLGLVKLIKSSIKQEMNLKFQKESENSNIALRQAIVNLANKQSQYDKLKKGFDLLQNENHKLDEKIKELRAYSPQIKKEKLTKLKNYTTGFKKELVKNN